MVNKDFTYYHNLNNNIIQRFQNGKISIEEAFKLLTDYKNINNDNTNNNTNQHNRSTSGQINNDNRDNRRKTDNKQIDKTELISRINNADIADISDINDSKKINYNNIPSIKELNNLVGLNEVKELIKDYIAFIKIQKLRKSYGLKSQPIVMHMVFKGNPGTGKTTVARIIGNIFNEIGFLENGKMIETERADLVGEYIGHTAQKTKEKINEAEGGVLFIDEAYSLARGGKRDFGRESIDTLVKAMEDYRDNLIIILAGYKNEMEMFLNSNPGLRSRLAIHLNFPDYSLEELVQIGEMMLKEREYMLTSESKHYIYRKLSLLHNKEGISRGNARTVRNLIEKSIRHQARRIIDSNSLNKKELMIIKTEDLAREGP